MTVEDFREALDKLDGEISALSGMGDPDAAGELLVAVHEFKRKIGELYKAIEHVTLESMGSQRVLNVAGKSLERKPGSKRKAWDHEGLRNLVYLRLMDLSLDEDTGEMTLTPGQAIESLLEFAAVSYWRVSKLKELDINADMYCEVEEGDESIAVLKGKE